MKIKQYNFTFMDRIPDDIEDGMIYISIPFNIAIHNCACGCGEKVVTPIDPKGWTFVYDGDTVSFSPSIGNFSYTCGSHYYIKKNNVVWVPPLSVAEVPSGKGKKAIKKRGFWDFVFRR